MQFVSKLKSKRFMRLKKIFFAEASEKFLLYNLNFDFYSNFNNLESVIIIKK